MILAGFVGLTGGIAWLIERFVTRNSSDAFQRYRAVGRALHRVHRAMRRRSGVSPHAR